MYFKGFVQHLSHCKDGQIGAKQCSVILLSYSPKEVSLEDSTVLSPSSDSVSSLRAGLNPFHLSSQHTVGV